MMADADAAGEIMEDLEEIFDCDLYAREYDAFRSFTFNSLDITRPYLLALNFPIFVHSYLRLINEGHGNTARAFFDRVSMHFLEHFYSEVIQLSLVTHSEFLASELFLLQTPFM